MRWRDCSDRGGMGRDTMDLASVANCGELEGVSEEGNGAERLFEHRSLHIRSSMCPRTPIHSSIPFPDNHLDHSPPKILTMSQQPGSSQNPTNFAQRVPVQYPRDFTPAMWAIWANSEFTNTVQRYVRDGRAPYLWLIRLVLREESVPASSSPTTTAAPPLRTSWRLLLRTFPGDNMRSCIGTGPR